MDGPSSQTTTTAEPHHLLPLDGIRGIAILLVLACHSAEAYLPHGTEHHGFGWRLYELMGAGWVGVDLFFVLSGFLITGILLASKEHDGYFKTFYMRRLLRIAPLYYAYLLVAVLAGQLHILHPVPLWDAVSTVFYLQNFFMAAQGHFALLLSHLWSLSIEEHFYLLWPLIIFCLDRKWIRRTCFAGIVFSLSCRLGLLHWSSMYRTVYYITPCRLDGLLAGAWLATLRLDQIAWHRLQRNAMPVALLAATAIGCIVLWQGHLFDFVRPDDLQGFVRSSRTILGPGITLLSLFWGALLVLGLTRPGLKACLSFRPLRQVGKYSYGMYVLHLECIIRVQNTPGLRNIRNLPFSAALLLGFIAVTGLTFCVAAVSFHCLEQPFLKLKRYFPSASIRPVP